MKKKSDFFGLVSLFISIVTGAVNAVIFCRPLYVLAVDFFDLSDKVSLSKEKILFNYDVLIRFLYSPWETKLKLPDFVSSAQGISHFKEVRVLFWLALILFILTIIPTILFVRRITLEKARIIFARPMQFAVIFSLMMVGFLSLSFETFFEKFHRLLFRNDDWLFNPAKDPVIEILPEGYFMWCFLLFFVLVEGCFLFFWWKAKRNSSDQLSQTK